MKKKKKKQRSNEDIDPPSLKLVTKIQKYMARSAADKLDGLLHKLRRSERKRLVSLENQLGESLLHQACRSGQESIVDILLKHGARTEGRDYGGNTPAHLAASAGHMDILMQLLQSNKPPDIDIMNDEGVSIQALADRALGMPTSITAPVRGRAAGHGPRDGSESEGGSDGSMEWRRKLREAESDAEGVVDGEHGLNEGGWGPEQGLGGHTPQEESEDAWADRMWAEMSRRRRAAADQAA
ncbi:ANK_REP_REGION domain-containing protein, partial [Haematococcus lacustris]